MGGWGLVLQIKRGALAQGFFKLCIYGSILFTYCVNIFILIYNELILTFSSLDPKDQMHIQGKILAYVYIFISSPKPKALVGFSDHNLSGGGCVVNFSHFFSFPISTIYGKKYPWLKGIQVLINEGPYPCPRGDNYVIVKIH